VRLAGSIVPDDKHAFVVTGQVKLELRDYDICDLVGHSIGNDVCLNEPASFWLNTGLAQLDNARDWFKLDKIAITHATAPAFS
jgi:hypothetical protein